MVAGGGCVSSRHMLDSVDFALVQAQKEPRITRSNAVSKISNSPSHGGDQNGKGSLLFNRSRSMGSKRNKGPDEADWGVSPKPVRNRSRSRGGTPRGGGNRSNSILFGDQNRSPRSLLKSQKESPGKRSEGISLAQLTPTERLRSLERQNKKSASNSGRNITPTRSRVLESRTPLHRMRSRHKGLDQRRSESPDRRSRRTDDDQAKSDGTSVHRNGTRRSSSNGHGGNRPATPDRDSYLPSMVESRNDEQYRRQRFINATDLREELYNSSKTGSSNREFIHEPSSIDFEQSSATREDDIEESTWDSPRYASTSKGPLGLDPVENFRDHLKEVDGDDIPHKTLASQPPKVNSITNWGITEMVSDLSCSSSGLHQEHMRARANRTAEEAKKTFSFATEKIQQALLDAKKQIYPGEPSIEETSLEAAKTRENKSSSSRQRSSDPNIGAPARDRKTSTGHGRNRNDANNQRTLQTTGRKSSWRDVTSQHAIKKSSSMQEPSLSRSRSRSPDPMRSYHNSRSKAQINVEKLNNPNHKNRERPRTPDVIHLRPQTLGKARSYVKTPDSVGLPDDGDATKLKRSRSASGLTFREKLLKDAQAEPKSISSGGSSNAIGMTRARSLTPSLRKPADRSPSPTPMQITPNKTADTGRSRSITPSRLFGFGRRKQNSENVPVESIVLVEKAEERLRLIRQKREIEEKLAAINQESVGGNSDISPAVRVPSPSASSTRSKGKPLGNSARETTRSPSPSPSTTMARNKKHSPDKSRRETPRASSPSIPPNKTGEKIETKPRSSSPRDAPRAVSPSTSITRIQPKKKKSTVQRLFGSMKGKSKYPVDTNMRSDNNVLTLEMLRDEKHDSRGRQGNTSMDAFQGKLSRSKNTRESITKRWFGGKREEVPHRANFEMHNGSSAGAKKYYPGSSRASRRSSRDRILIGGASAATMHSHEGSISAGSSRDPSHASSSTRPVKHTTTFDSLMKAIADDKQATQATPPAEFAVVELGDENHAIKTHSVLMNRTDVERQLVTATERGGRQQESEKHQPKQHRRQQRSHLEKSRFREPLPTSARSETHDDSELGQLEASSSFTKRLKTLSKPPHRIPKGAYMI